MHVLFHAITIAEYTPVKARRIYTCEDFCSQTSSSYRYQTIQTGEGNLGEMICVIIEHVGFQILEGR